MKKIFAFIVALLAVAQTSLWAAEPNDYYKSCEGKTGEALLKALREVVGPHKNVGYDGLWAVYNKSDVDGNGKYIDIYSTKRWTPGKEKCGTYKYVGDCVNREHSFPKSWFDDRSPMMSDAFHIYPTDGKVNGQRSNFPYGECANGTTLSSSNGVQALGKLGTSYLAGIRARCLSLSTNTRGTLRAHTSTWRPPTMTKSAHGAPTCSPAMRIRPTRPGRSTFC